MKKTLIKAAILFVGMLVMLVGSKALADYSGITASRGGDVVQIGNKNIPVIQIVNFTNGAGTVSYPQTYYSNAAAVFCQWVDANATTWPAVTNMAINVKTITASNFTFETKVTVGGCATNIRAIIVGPLN